MATDTTLKTVERALRLLEIVASQPSPPQIREVAEMLEHNITSTYHLANTLIASGYLTKSPAGRLSIGSKVTELNASYIRNSDIGASVRSLIASLASSTEETVYLSRYNANATVIEFVVESTRSLKVTGLRVGYSGLEDQRASGRAVLAHLAPDELEAAFAHLHPDLSATQRSRVFAELSGKLETVRKDGYAFDDEEFEEGVCCVAVAYYGADGAVAGAIAASAPSQRKARLLSEVGPQIAVAARTVTELMSQRA